MKVSSWQSVVLTKSGMILSDPKSGSILSCNVMAEMATKTDNQNYRNRSNSDSKPNSDTPQFMRKK